MRTAAKKPGRKSKTQKAGQKTGLFVFQISDTAED
jgi:hypothetical protein